MVPARCVCTEFHVAELVVEAWSGIVRVRPGFSDRVSPAWSREEPFRASGLLSCNFCNCVNIFIYTNLYLVSCLSGFPFKQWLAGVNLQLTGPDQITCTVPDQIRGQQFLFDPMNFCVCCNQLCSTLQQLLVATAVGPGQRTSRVRGWTIRQE